MNYKETLNLPRTAFPMKANLAQREPKRVQFWQKNDIYQKANKQLEGEKKFVLHDGPPYANGSIHIGHAVNKILKDTIVKSKRLSGYQAPYVPGWDCHGLPIEINVEKKVGKVGVKVNKKDFRQACRDYAFKQVEQQKEDFVRLGVLGDWENPYLTLDSSVEADIMRALGSIIEQGHLQQGFKPVYWSVASGSALAEAEVEYQEKTSFAIDVAFSVANRADFLAAFGDDFTDIAACNALSVLIWTTTPWTLPANQAVCFHPELEYALVQVTREKGPEHFVIASDLVESCMERYGIQEDKYSLLGACVGEKLVKQLLQHPFYEKEVPIILGGHVTTEAGTGCVHTAPDHGIDDFNAGLAYGLGTLNLLNDEGVFRENTLLFAGEHVYKTDALVLEVLKSKHALIHEEKIRHSYPHCWRTKKPLIFRATPQWFISMEKKKLLEQAMNAIPKVEWVPPRGEQRIRSMLEFSPDWCISRQRTWGVPIPLFVNKESGELHPDTHVLVEKIASMVAESGIDVWDDLDMGSLLGASAKDYTKVEDTLDVWFDSGVTHFAVLQQRPELSFPADLYLEGSDQHRGWFQSSLKTAIAIHGKAPYKQVLTHGFTVDSDGKKMSKSQGNVVAPQQIMKTLGADVLRLWVSATDFTYEMSVSEEILKRTTDAYRRIRNTARFFLANLDGFDPEVDLVSHTDLLALDAWAIDTAYELDIEIRKAYSSYELLTVFQKIQHFCVVDMGGFYLDVIKDRQYTNPSKSLARRSVQTAFYHIAHAFVRWIAPILSFTAEEIWEYLPKLKAAETESVFLTQWYEALAPLCEKGSFDRDFWNQIIAIKSAVNKEIEKSRAEGLLKDNMDAIVDISCSNDLYEILMQLGEELKFVLQTSEVRVQPFLGSRKISSDAEGFVIKICQSSENKCERCWHRVEGVGKIEAHPTLCERCVTNIESSGEDRKYI